MSLNFVLLYGATVFIASIIPGPSMLLALTHGMRFGARRAIASALGNLAVTLVQAMISIAGLGTILIASESAFQIIKYFGAAYLVFMGVCVFLSPNMSFTPNGTGQAPPKISLSKMFSQAAMVTAGNPKAIVFFTAIFPQFINPSASYLPQSCMLLSIGSIIAFGCFMLYAICGQKLVFLFSQATIGKYINRVIGGTFVGAGVGLAVSNK
ncbi:MAG: LysE family translocator [Sedimentisphaerales bacterium]|nr:LysE family translocator [Sedimentisphaerales bacterium]